MNRTRKCAALLIALCMMLTMLPAGASAATDSGQDDSAQFDYRFVTENTIEITAYKGSLERLIIPETLDGYTVVGIADMSLKQRNDNPVAYIEVPDTVTYIGERAFGTVRDDYSISGLETIVLPEGLKTIGDRAFYNCASLKTINIPSTVTSIGDKAFFNSGLENLSLPGEITDIGEGAFLRTAWLQEQVNRAREEGKDFIFINDTICYFVGEKTSGHVEIPDGVQRVEEEIFYYGGYGVTSVSLPASVTEIGDNAFSSCGHLTEVTFRGDSRLKRIGNNAFYWCKTLPAISLPQGLEEIGEYAFEGCTELADITFPDSLYIVHRNSIEDTPWLAKQKKGALYLGKAFLWNFEMEKDDEKWADRSKLPKTISLRADTKGIAGEAFYGDVILSQLGYHAPNLASFPAGLLYIGPNSLTGFEKIPQKVPDSVTYIGDEAGLSASHAGDLPPSLVYLGRRPFSGSIGTGTLTITIPKSLTYIGDYAFEEIMWTSSESGGLRIVFPEGSQLTYMGAQAFAFNQILSVSGWPKAIVSWDDYFRYCMMSSLTLPDEILNVLRISCCYGFPVDLNKTKAIGDVGTMGHLSFDMDYAESTLSMKNVERISNSFISGDGLTWLEFGENFHYMEDELFLNADELKVIVLNGDAPTISGDPFGRNVPKIYRPENASGYDSDTWKSMTVVSLKPGETPDLTGLIPPPKGKGNPAAAAMAQTISGAKAYTKTYGNKPFYLNARGKTKLTYQSGNKKVATVSAAGRVTLKGPGRTTITVRAAATSKYKGAVKKITLTVKPKKAISRKAVSKKARTLQVRWKRDKKATGYQVTIARNKKFKKGKKTVFVRKNKTTAKTFKKLKRKKTYYCKVRAYKQVGKTKIYGAYSKARKIKVR